MSRLTQLLTAAQAHFDEDERSLAVVVGQFHTRRARNDGLKTGIMIATDRRLLFYAKRLFGYQLEHFSYRGISSFEQGRRMLGPYIRFFASGNEVSLKWISEGDVETFAATVRQGMANGSATWAGIARCAEAQQHPQRVQWAGIVLCLFVVGGCAGLFILLAGEVASPARSQSRTAKNSLTKPSATNPHPANPFAPAEPLQFDGARAAEGQVLYEAIIADYPTLYRFSEEGSLAPLTNEYTVVRTDGWRNGVDIRNVDTGFAAIVYIPESRWDRLADTEREVLGHFLSRESPHTGWSIYVGRIQRFGSRDEILGDKISMSSRDWEWAATP